MVEDERNEPCHRSSVDDLKNHPLGACLATDGDQCGNTREVKQDEQHERVGDNRVEHGFAVGLRGGLQLLLE